VQCDEGDKTFPQFEMNSEYALFSDPTRQLELDISHLDWDRELAKLGGHPWQSAHWDNAEHVAHGVKSHRLLLRCGGETVQMVRVEQRMVGGVCKLAWIRHGPTGRKPDAGSIRIEPEISQWLSDHGFCLVVASPWKREVEQKANRTSRKAQPRTIWIDLSVGRDQLWQNLNKTWRAHVRRAQRHGVVVETTRDSELIAEYFALCSHIGRVKGFEVRTSVDLIEQLINTCHTESVETKLFIAKCEGQIASGALVARCGKSIHYMGGASNRDFARQKPGEALHWAIVEWGLAKKCTRYDLEGIDPAGNPGVYAFKKKMGGEEVTLVGRHVSALNLTGRLLAPLAVGFLSSPIGPLASVAKALLGSTFRPAR